MAKGSMLSMHYLNVLRNVHFAYNNFAFQSITHSSESDYSISLKMCIKKKLKNVNKKNESKNVSLL